MLRLLERMNTERVTRKNRGISHFDCSAFYSSKSDELELMVNPQITSSESPSRTLCCMLLHFALAGKYSFPELERCAQILVARSIHCLYFLTLIWQGQAHFSRRVKQSLSTTLVQFRYEEKTLALGER